MADLPQQLDRLLTAGNIVGVALPQQEWNCRRPHVFNSYSANVPYGHVVVHRQFKEPCDFWKGQIGELPEFEDGGGSMKPIVVVKLPQQ